MKIAIAIFVKNQCRNCCQYGFYTIVDGFLCSMCRNPRPCKNEYCANKVVGRVHHYCQDCRKLKDQILTRDPKLIKCSDYGVRVTYARKEEIHHGYCSGAEVEETVEDKLVEIYDLPVQFGNLHSIPKWFYKLDKQGCNRGSGYC